MPERADNTRGLKQFESLTVPYNNHHRKTSAILAKPLITVLSVSGLLLLSACGGGSGGAGTAPVELGAALPEEGNYVAITQQNSSLSEAARIGSVDVARVGDGTGSTSVHYRFVSGSASAGSDYHAVDGVLNWAAGETGNRTIEFLVESDIQAENEEDFSIELFDIEGADTLGINDSVTVSITNSVCDGSIPASIGSNTLLSASCYHMTQSVSVAGSAQLEVAAGTTIIADAGTDLTVAGNANMNISGTAALPVVLKGSQTQAGFWNGVNLDSSSALHRIQHARITDAVNAVDLSTGGFANFTHNTLNNNSGAGLAVNMNMADSIGTANQYTGSVRGIELRGGNIDQNQTIALPAQDTHYTLATSIINNGNLKLHAGVDLRMSADATILVLSTGSVNAVGTAEKPIVIQGLEPRHGFWNGIQYVSSASDNNRFEYTTIAHGGGDPARPGNIIVDGLDTRISLMQCALTHSEGYGMVYDSGSFQVDLMDVEFSENRLGEQSL